MIDNADLAILETYLDTMNDVERGLVEELRRARDELEEAEKQLSKSISPVSFNEVEERAKEAEDALEEAERERDKARDLAEERSKEIDDLRKQLSHAERREDEATKRAVEAERTIENAKKAIQAAFFLGVAS